MTSQSKNNRLLPLTVIEAAAGGDVEAINAVLKHYAGYIALSVCLRTFYARTFSIQAHCLHSAAGCTEAAGHDNSRGL